MILRALIVVLPWSLKRLLLRRVFGYELHRSARIGLSWIYPGHLVMAAGAQIGHLNVAVHLDHVELGANATIGRSNWITGFPTGTVSEHFAHQPDRRSTLIVGRETAITKGHHIDCTAPVTIGAFTTVAGYDTHVLTHSIDIARGRQDSAPVSIGDYCFVGTKSLLLGGCALPDYSVLGGLSMLNRAFDEPYALYGGNPAARIKSLDADSAYFTRATGFVV